MKKVVSIVLNNFKNDSRVLKEAISLQNAGYRVIVVAIHEEDLKEFEEIENIAVHRIKVKSKNWSRNRFIQVLKYFEFIYIVTKKYRDTDILHCNDLNALPVGVVIKKFFNKNAKIVYDAHEYETETFHSKGLRKVFTKIFEKILIKHVDRVITVSPKIADEYVRLYQINRPKIVLNTPYFRENIVKKDLFREKFEIDKKKKIFLYQGALNRGRGIEILLESFKDIKQAVIVFMGYGAFEALVQKYSKEYPNIYFHEAVPHMKILDYSSSADFGIATIEDSCLSYRYCLPNKMFEYVMANVPILVSNLPEMKRIVLENKIGVVAYDNSVKGLKKTIEEACEMNVLELQENVDKVKSIYNWESQEQILLELYHEL